MPLIRLLIVAIAALCFQSISYAGQYHVCTDENGKKLFTSNPCPEDQAAATRSYKASASHNQNSSVSLEDNESYQSMRDNNRRLELKRNIKNSEKNLQSLEVRRDAELAKLRLKKNRANNNAAGAIWLQSISTEMGTVNDRYKSKIESEQRKLDKMLDELSGLK